MTTVTTLNENETKVLNALNKEAKESTGGEFGCIMDVKRGKFSKHEFAGYIASLQAKGVFEDLNTDYSDEYGGQYSINEQYR